MADAPDMESLSYRIRRDASGVVAWCKTRWHDNKWFRRGVILGALMLIGLFVLWVIVVRNLPDAESLLEYETPLPTVVRGMDGDIVHSYARERRVQLEYVDFPEPLIDAYLAAEDKTFFSHGGIDAGGVAGAILDYVTKIGSGERAVGGSTITQQVAKNILLSNEYSMTRKMKEMILARRIENALSKEQILSLYLNEIPLGRRSFGVQAASLAYFDKDVSELELHEIAFLAILPKAPEKYGRDRHVSAALGRRNFVLNKMVENDFISAEEAAAAKTKPLGLVEKQSSRKSADAGYFFETVRRQLIEEFGETAEESPNSVYSGGLWVRTSLDQEMQDSAREALRDGLVRYHAGRGWRGPIDKIVDFDEDEWASQLFSTFISINYKNWRVGVVTERTSSVAKIGFTDESEFPLTNVPTGLKQGDIVAAVKVGNNYSLRTIPAVSGGFVAQQPNTGRILAMQGGFDARLGAFNRATQANRQPGSSIKPFVYVTGLENGMTPSTEIENGRYCYYQGSRFGEKCFRGGRAGSFPMRYGLEQSQNIMTVKIAMDSGMPKVVKTIKNMGIGSYEPYPAFALGAGETTVVKMVNAYSALANHGRLNEPTLIDYVQDRHGKVIMRADKRDCTGCNMPQWDGKRMPRFGLKGRQIVDARSAYQTVHMLHGVVQRGTATVLRSLDIPIFGKTGTTTGSKDVWFVGGTPDVIAGAFVGYDTPRRMGGYAQGGTVAAPIVKKFFEGVEDRMSGDPFVAPAGIRMVRIDRASGKRVFGTWPTGDPKAAVIWEAFKPDTEPPRATRRDEIESRRAQILQQIRRGAQARTETTRSNRRRAPAEEDNFVEDQGGIY